MIPALQDQHGILIGKIKHKNTLQTGALELFYPVQ